MAKKVLFCSHVAGFSRFNTPYMEWFHKQGWQVDYAANGDMPIPHCDNFYNIPFSRSPFSLSNVKAYLQLKRLIDSQSYDIIHCHTPVGGTVARLAAMRARKRGTKVLYTAHGFHFYKDAPLLNWLLYYPVEKALARFTDCLITINDEDYRTARERRFKVGEICKIDGVGVDLTRFYPASPEEKSSLRHKYGFHDDEYILIYIGELNKNKNQHLLIEAVNNLTYIIPNIRLLLVGDGPLKPVLKRLIAKLGLENNVTLMGYCLDVRNLLCISDLCTASSLREGLAVNVLESMACGIPIIASDNRGHRPLVVDGQNGYLFPLGNNKVLINQILLLHSNPSLANKISQNNSVAAIPFSLTCSLSSMDEIYKRYMNTDSILIEN